MSESSANLLFTLSESAALAADVARRASIELAPLEERPFEEGEFKLRPLVSVRERTVFVLESLAGTADAPVAQRLVRLLFLLFGLRDAGAARTIALVPYLSYARKDRRTQLRDPVNTRYVAQLLEATGVARLVALDVHNPAALDNAFRIPVDHLSALPMFADHFARRLPGAELVVASPDVGGIKRVQVFREMLARRVGRDIDLAFVEKRRARGIVSGGAVAGSVAGRTAIVLDDLCATGGTLIRAAAALTEAGAAAVHVAVTHAPLAKGLTALLAAPGIAGIVITDSVGTALHARAPSEGDRLTILPVAPLLAEAVSRIIGRIPLAPLLERWPPADRSP
jgi:ribose-phosphate pyrophosphokinase